VAGVDRLADVDLLALAGAAGAAADFADDLGAAALAGVRLAAFVVDAGLIT